MWREVRHSDRIFRGGAEPEDGQREEKGAEDATPVPSSAGAPAAAPARPRVRRSHRPPLRVLIQEIAAHQSYSSDECLNRAYTFILRRNRAGNPPTKAEVWNVLKDKLQFRFFADTVEDSTLLNNVNGLFFTSDLQGNRLTNFSMPLQPAMRVEGAGLRAPVIEVTHTDAILDDHHHMSYTGQRFTIAHPNMVVTRPCVEGETVISSVDFANSQVRLSRAVDATKQQMEFVLHADHIDGKALLRKFIWTQNLDRRRRSNHERHMYLLIMPLIDDSVRLETPIIDNLHLYNGADRFVRAIEDHVIYGLHRDTARRFLINSLGFDLLNNVLDTTPAEDETARRALYRRTDLMNFRVGGMWTTQYLKDQILASKEKPYIVADDRPGNIVRVTRGAITHFTKYLYEVSYGRLDSTEIREIVSTDTIRVWFRSRHEKDNVVYYLHEGARTYYIWELYALFHMFSKAFNYYLREHEPGVEQRAVDFAMAMVHPNLPQDPFYY